MNKKKTDSRILQTRQRLSEALTTLLKTQPLETITVIDLVNEANINRSTFYLRYTSLEDFIKDLEREHYSHFRTQIMEFFDTDTGWLDQLMNPDIDTKFSIIEYILQMIEKNTQIQAFMSARLYNSQFLVKMVEDGYDSAHKAVLASHHEVDPMKFRYFYSFISMGCVGLIFNWIQSGMVDSSQEMSQLVHRFVKQSLKSTF